MKAGGSNPILRDCLYNLNPDIMKDHQYGKGILVGVVATLMGTRGFTFEEAIDAVKYNAPHGIAIEAIPEGWIN